MCVCKGFWQDHRTGRTSKGCKKLLFLQEPQYKLCSLTERKKSHTKTVFNTGVHYYKPFHYTEVKLLFTQASIATFPLYSISKQWRHYEKLSLKIHGESKKKYRLYIVVYKDIFINTSFGKNCRSCMHQQIVMTLIFWYWVSKRGSKVMELYICSKFYIMWCVLHNLQGKKCWKNAWNVQSK